MYKLSSLQHDVSPDAFLVEVINSVVLLLGSFLSMLSTMSSSFATIARRTWPFLYVVRLSSTFAFSFSGYTSLTTSIKQSAALTRTISVVPADKRISQKLANIRCFTASSDDIITTGGSSLQGATTSSNFAMDPYSEEARSITESLGISLEQHEKLITLSNLIVEWNERLNLISRKDCNLEVVFGRHVLPSIALAGLTEFQDIKDSSLDPRIVDVGTGGGFPGLPLSIIFPEANFLLVDSVGKKLKAIDEMASELKLNNIATHHGRAEQIADDPIIGRKHRRKYDICVGRSVTAMPRFCFWIQDLLKKDGGKLVYIIGGEVEEIVESRVESDIPIDELLRVEGASDKRTLILTSDDVVAVAQGSGEKKITTVTGKPKSQNTKRMKQNDEGRWNKSKGGWSDRNNGEKKDRGYSNFKRYESD